MPQAKSCRIVFMGTPELAAVVLRRLADWSGGEVVAVYTQPDRPAGRGQKLRPSPVKEAALALGLPVRQSENFRDAESVAELAALTPDVLALTGLGMIPLFLAIYIGNKIQKKINQTVFLKTTYILLAVSGISVLVS